VLYLVDLAISALAQLLQDCVVAERLTYLKNGDLLEPNVARFNLKAGTPELQ
jgi:hypothetical protein